MAADDEVIITRMTPLALACSLTKRSMPTLDEAKLGNCGSSSREGLGTCNLAM